MRPPKHIFHSLLLLTIFVAGGQAAQASTSSYPELLDAVCTKAASIHPVTARAPSLKGKEVLVDEAERLTLPQDTRQLLIERLSNNAFSIDEAELWAPLESFDITLQSRGEDAGLLKAKLSAQRYREYSERISHLPPPRQDAIRRTALVILADTGHLPEITLADSRARFLYREACVVDDAPGLMTTYMQGRLRELDLDTGNLGPTIFLQPEKATLSDPAVAFPSDGSAAFRVRAQQIEHIFAQPATRQVMRNLYDQTLEIIRAPDEMKEQLVRLVDLFQRAYGIEPVNFVFDTSTRTSGGSAYYHGSTSSYVFHYDRFIQKLDRLVEQEQLDLTRPDDRKRARDHMFGELVNNAAHEIAHAGQRPWTEQWMRTPQAIPAALQPRIADYHKNQAYKNIAWESHALIGILGSADYDRYRHQPLEEDAWAIGAYAETRALELLSGGEQTSQVQETLLDPALPAPTAREVAVNYKP